MNESKLTKEERKIVREYLNKNKWPDDGESIRCPICGGMITGKDIGNSYEAKCSTPGCYLLELRGI